MVDRRDLVDRSAIIRPELIEVRFIMKEHDDLRIVQLDVESQEVVPGQAAPMTWAGSLHDLAREARAGRDKYRARSPRWPLRQPLLNNRLLAQLRR